MVLKSSSHKVLHFDFGDQWAVRCGNWKLIANVEDVTPNKRESQKGLFLSNLEKDNTESENLAERYPQK